MNITSLITDNISELLVKIIEFTQSRQITLTQNINNIHEPEFVPQDLAVDEFTEVLNHTIEEHIRHQRLVLCDTENIKFGAGGSFSAEPIIDEYARELLEASQDEYIELQISKLLENSLNQRIAAELLKQKHGMISILE